MPKPNSSNDYDRIVSIVKESQEAQYRAISYELRLVFGEDWPEADKFGRMLAEYVCPISPAKEIKEKINYPSMNDFISKFPIDEMLVLKKATQILW